MKELAQKLSNIFKRTETEASKKFWGNVGGASDIVRSVRESEKLQVRSKFWRQAFFFLIAAALIIFVLSYVY